MADCTVFQALAEALAYGRDRETLRAASQNLLANSNAEVLLEASQHLPCLEQRRIAGLAQLFERWQATGPWQSLHAGIPQDDLRQARQILLTQSQVAGGAVSLGRAAILVANVVLPFALAWAALHTDALLAERTLAP